VTNKPKIAGTRFESAVVAYLRENGFPWAERRAQGGSNDRGDVAGVVPWTLELKATRQIDLAGAVDEAETEWLNEASKSIVKKWLIAHARYAAIIKRRNKGVDRSYVVMPLCVFVDLIREDSPG
jgi:hypothetical protein